MLEYDKMLFKVFYMRQLRRCIEQVLEEGAGVLLGGYLGQEHSRQRDQPVQKPWGIQGMSEEPQRGQGGLSEVREVE